MAGVLGDEILHRAYALTGRCIQAANRPLPVGKLMIFAAGEMEIYGKITREVSAEEAAAWAVEAELPPIPPFPYFYEVLCD